MPSPNLSELATTTLERRTKKIRDNVTNNNALLFQMSKKGRIQMAPGGRLIYEEISYSENGNAGWYSGFDVLSVAQTDNLTAAEFNWKQAAAPVVVSGLELLQNSGEDAVINLVSEKVNVAEATMKNLIEDGLFSDGTGSGGKEITGLDAAVPQDPTTGTYGGINRATSTNAFWRSQLRDSASTPTASTIQTEMSALYVACTRGTDKPDLIISGGTIYLTFLASLQAIQRVTNPEMANAGFSNVEFMGTPVVLGGGIGGVATATDMYFLNTNYLKFRPHKDRYMVPLKKRVAQSQDAEIEILAFAGNLTCSGSKFQGRLKGD